VTAAPNIQSKDMMSFSSLGLSEGVLRAVADQGYRYPTPIQQHAIPIVLAGSDLLAGAQTGTGKTAGFVLPLLERLCAAPPVAAGSSRKSPRALILTPTRELAAQVDASVRTYGRHVRIASAAIFGGVGFGPQVSQLRRGVDIVVATPGRLLDHLDRGKLDLSRIEMFVLDEADRMLDMGFMPAIERVIAALPKRRQNLLFSATFSKEIKALAGGILNRPQTIELTPPNSTVDTIAQRVHLVDRGDKSRLLAWLVGHHRWRQVLVFTRTKHGADKLAQSLERDGIQALALHGDKSQGERSRALARFKSGGVNVLVATDIAARGLDISDLPHVVNFDMPNTATDYVHRIGRTGRAGSRGEAVSLVSRDERGLLRDIERLIKQTIPQHTVAGFEPDPGAGSQPTFAKPMRRSGWASDRNGAGRKRNSAGSHAARGKAATSSAHRARPR
jgi:ATP-dependent RNA helicase RhlE